MAESLDRILSARAPDRRSPLHRWLFENHDRIAKFFASQARPGWTVLAETAATEGVVDSNGNPSSVNAVRKARNRVARVKQCRT
jgi:hypothetical protein